MFPAQSIPLVSMLIGNSHIPQVLCAIGSSFPLQACVKPTVLIHNYMRLLYLTPQQADASKQQRRDVKRDYMRAKRREQRDQEQEWETKVRLGAERHRLLLHPGNFHG